MSQARSRAAVVAFPVAIFSLRKPAAGALPADSSVLTVEFSCAELRPWRLRADFVVYYSYGKWKSVNYEYVLVGIGLEALHIAIEVAENDWEALAERASIVRRTFNRNVESYGYQAELALRRQRQELGDVRLALVEGKAHHHLPLVVALFRELKGVPGGRVSDVRGLRRRANHDLPCPR